MMPPAIGNPPCTSNRIVTAAVCQLLAAKHCRLGGHLIEMRRLRVELTCEPLDLCLVEHLRAAGEVLSDTQVVEVINCHSGPQCDAAPGAGEAATLRSSGTRSVAMMNATIMARKASA